MNNKMTNEFNKYTEMAYNTARNEKPVYINFSATKMSNAVKPNTIVEFTDFMGKKHKVVCRNKPEMLKAMKFFSELKKESAEIKRVITDYPLYYGQIDKKFIPAVKRELKALKLSPKAIENVLIMYWAQ
jgi:hypothetical protein